MNLIRSKCVIRYVIFTGLLILISGVVSAQSSAGVVRFGRRTGPSFDTYSNSPTLAQQQWMQQHFWRMVTYSPYFDTRTSWYPSGFVYIDSYAIYTGSALVTQHPEWILKDANGNRLYIPWGCSNGTCPQYAADTSNPGYRQWWISQAAAIVPQGYKGIFVDDVNMNFQVSNGYGNLVVPIDPNTGTLMSWDNWRKYMAGFMQQIRSAFPSIEIVHNSVWYAGPDGVRDQDAYAQQQIAAANYQYIEFGVDDGGLTNGTGIWSLNSLLGYIDRLHAVNKAAIISGIPLDATAREYALANYFAVSAGMDGLDDTVTTPDNWWKGFEVNLGSPLGARTTWNNLLRRDFTGGMVLVNAPGNPTVNVTLPAAYKRVDGTSVTSVTLAGKQGAVLLTSGVADTTPPVVSLASLSGPLAGTITVTATATDNVGVAAVDFYVDNTFQSTSTSMPYSFAWNTKNFPDGNHTVSAIARDAAGNKATASASVLIVNTAPSSLTALITWPTNGLTIWHGTTFTIYATATNAVAVTFYVDGRQVGNQEVWGGPVAYYSTPWSASQWGYHTVTAVAQGANGSTVTSPAVQVQVQ